MKRKPLIGIMILALIALPPSIPAQAEEKKDDYEEITMPVPPAAQPEFAMQYQFQFPLAQAPCIA